LLRPFSALQNQSTNKNSVDTELRGWDPPSLAALAARKQGPISVGGGARDSPSYPVSPDEGLRRRFEFNPALCAKLARLLPQAE
jgi:hypothetical protein